MKRKWESECSVISSLHADFGYSYYPAIIIYLLLEPYSILLIFLLIDSTSTASLKAALPSHAISLTAVGCMRYRQHAVFLHHWCNFRISRGFWHHTFLRPSSCSTPSTAPEIHFYKSYKHAREEERGKDRSSRAKTDICINVSQPHS